MCLMVSPQISSVNPTYLYCILLMAARTIINWMKVQEPTVTEWTHRLKHIFEKMTADLQLKSDIFERILSICLK